MQLGAEPSFSQAVGDEIANHGSGPPIASTGVWILAGGDQRDRSLLELDSQIRNLLSRLTDDLKVWDEISRLFSAGLYFTLPPQEADVRCVLSPDTLSMVGDRKLEIGFRVHSNVESSLWGERASCRVAG